MPAPDLARMRELAVADPSAAVVELATARGEREATPAHLYLHAQLLADAGRPDEALTLIDEAEFGFCEVGLDLDAARCDAGRSNVLEDLGRQPEADAPGRAARVGALLELTADLDNERWPVQAALVHLQLADVLAERPGEAERHLRRALALAGTTGVPHLGARRPAPGGVPAAPRPRHGSGRRPRRT